jgi:hypothetical protein
MSAYTGIQQHIDARMTQVAADAVHQRVQPGARTFKDLREQATGREVSFGDLKPGVPMV